MEHKIVSIQINFSFFFPELYSKLNAVQNRSYYNFLLKFFLSFFLSINLLFKIKFHFRFLRRVEKLFSEIPTSLLNNVKNTSSLSNKQQRATKKEFLSLDSTIKSIQIKVCWVTKNFTQSSHKDKLNW